MKDIIKFLYSVGENDKAIRLTKAVKVLEMVEDNSKMPHPHEDKQTRLYCLSERAREVLND